MKTHPALLLATAALLLMAGAAIAQSGGRPGCAVVPGDASGGGYRLTTRAESPAVETSGGSYRLQAHVQPLMTGSGCCPYLPCIRKPRRYARVGGAGYWMGRRRMNATS
jgi:hypothetical protein